VVRQIFNAFSIRERYLVAIFIWAILIIWMLALVESLQKNWRNYSGNGRLLDNLTSLLEQTDQAEVLLRDARQGLDSTKTYSAAQLSGRLDSLARENQVSSFDISTASTIDSELFSFHNVRLSIKRARIAELIRFEQAVKQYSPYIALGDFQITANKRDPRYLDAVFELVSFELKEEALND